MPFHPGDLPGATGSPQGQLAVAAADVEYVQVGAQVLADQLQEEVLAVAIGHYRFPLVGEPPLGDPGIGPPAIQIVRDRITSRPTRSHTPSIPCGRWPGSPARKSK